MEDINLSDNNQDTKIYLDFKREDIDQYLKKFIELVNNNNYIICRRFKNFNFIDEYNIKNYKLKKVLLSLISDDFCYAEDNIKQEYKFKDEILYIFGKECEFSYAYESEVIKLFIKINLIESQDGSSAFVVSFHPEEKPLKYLFK